LGLQIRDKRLLIILKKLKLCYLNLSEVESLWVGHSGCPPTAEIENLKACWLIPSKVNQSHLFYLNFMPIVFLLNTYNKSKSPPSSAQSKLNDRWPVTSVIAQNHISNDPRAASHLVFTHYNIIILHKPRRQHYVIILNLKRTVSERRLVFWLAAGRMTRQWWPYGIRTACVMVMVDSGSQRGYVRGRGSGDQQLPGTPDNWQE